MGFPGTLSHFPWDFRGDTVHPSTVTLLGELGLRKKFLQLPLTRLPDNFPVLAVRERRPKMRIW